ncbi:MAG: leucyl aminopeptidase [Candidatus Heimdallarchaeota archaeon]|nr:leucyl aminopeptidase [Candidatus Heimdallarchaeota archaeon]
MEVKVKKATLNELETPILVIGLTEPTNEDSFLTKSTATSLQKQMKEIISLGDFKGEKEEYLITYAGEGLKAKRLMFIGLGKEQELSLEDLRVILGTSSRVLRDKGYEKIAICLDSFSRKDFTPQKVAKTLTEGIILGSYQNIAYKTKNLEKYKKIEELTFVSTANEEESFSKGVSEGKIVAEAVNFCRDLSWSPANYITPTYLANEAERIAKEYDNITTTVFDRAKCQEIGLHSFLAVAQGTEEPPKFIIMDYGSKLKDVDTIALIGKGITFDTGGISLKPSLNMLNMKADMTGGAVVLAMMEALAQLKPKVRVVGLVPATDNMPSGKAYHPGDIIKSYSGQTIEVISTDAEGRMIINDALTYAARNYDPKAMFDFATLTGSMMVALGNHAIGYFANDDQLAKKVEEASKLSGERVWRFPLWEVYDKQLKSDVADFKHTGGRPGGAITAARFLSKFVEDKPWVHMDIAGYANQENDDGYNPKGSKGPAVRLMLELLTNWNE